MRFGRAADQGPPGPVDQGPPGPGEGEADYLPISVGGAWTYDYEYDQDCLSPYVWRDGTSTVSFESETLTDSTRQIRASFQIEYEEATYDPWSGQTTTTEQADHFDFVITETPSGIVVEESDLRQYGFDLSPLPGPLPRYYPVSEGDVVYPLTTYRRLTLSEETPPQIWSLSGSCRSRPSIEFTPRG